MKNKIQITIGIPAHNEEANIKNLLKSILLQSGNLFEIKEIIVYSDASTDGTVKEAQSLNNSKINIVDNKKRQGKNTVQNKIFKKSTGDVLVIFDADILLKNNKVLNNLVKKYNDTPSTYIVSGKVSPAKPTNYVSEALSHSQKIKNQIYEKFANTNQVYICNGRIMSYAKEFYKKTQIPEKLLADDAYMCFLALSLGHRVVYQPKAEVIYHTPTTLNDHLKQSTRFFNGKKQLVRVFGKQPVNSQYSLPILTTLSYSLIGFLKEPKISLIYFLFLVTSFSKSLLPQKVVNSFWETAKSSKKIIEKYA